MAAQFACTSLAVLQWKCPLHSSFIFENFLNDPNSTIQPQWSMLKSPPMAKMTKAIVTTNIDNSKSSLDEEKLVIVCENILQRFITAIMIATIVTTIDQFWFGLKWQFWICTRNGNCHYFQLLLLPHYQATIEQILLLQQQQAITKQPLNKLFPCGIKEDSACAQEKGCSILNAWSNCW